jgi:hypothetical protein
VEEGEGEIIMINRGDEYDTKKRILDEIILGLSWILNAFTGVLTRENEGDLRRVNAKGKTM